MSGSLHLGCWIRPEYETERIIFEYLWMWFAAFVMLILYGIIAIVMRGLLIIDGKKWRWNWHQNARRSDRLRMDRLALDEEDEEERQSKAIANLMLL
jgi:hypothetical protein